jgi:pimeloyl-ACP methyl ester carboxylesterase
MHYFSGFGFQGESALFEEYLIKAEGVVAGFSYGAQEAFEYANNAKGRIDRLILLSPALFQTQSRSFKRAQLRYFQSDQASYMRQFITNLSYPQEPLALDPYLCVGSVEELDALLHYVWDQQRLEALIAQGVSVEVFVGSEDRIVPSEAVVDFFKQAGAIVYQIKGAGHLLQC